MKHKLLTASAALPVAMMLGCGAIYGLITAFGGEGEVAETVSGCIMQLASVVGYLVAEGLTDAAHKE